MPFKSNASRRDKFAKAKYRVKNQAEYNEALGLTFYPRCPVRCAVYGQRSRTTNGIANLFAPAWKLPGGRLSGGHFESVTVPEAESISSGVTV